MKWTGRVTDKKQWHRWFAWRPIYLDQVEVRYDAYRCRHSMYHQWRWLTHVERKYAGRESAAIYAYREAQCNALH